jgi:cell division septation protein DedD
VVPAAEPPKEAPKTVQTVTATPTPPVSPPITGGTGVYQIQLASVLSEQAALEEWGRISRNNKDILSSYSPTVVRADLGERGVFYRLRAGPLADKAAADALCSSLTAAKVGCIVVKP